MTAMVGFLIGIPMGIGITLLGIGLVNAHKLTTPDTIDHLLTCDCARCLNWQYQNEGRR